MVWAQIGLDYTLGKLMATVPLPRVEMVDLRQVQSRQLGALFDEQQSAWHEQLRWDYRPSVALIKKHIDARSLPGYAALLEGQVAGYCFFVYEEVVSERARPGAQKGLIGDLFVRQAYRPQPATRAERAGLATQLLERALEALATGPEVARIEAQLMPFGIEPLAPLFLAHDFRSYPRLFMYKALRETSGASREEQTGSSVGFASLRKAPMREGRGVGPYGPCQEQNPEPSPQLAPRFSAGAPAWGRTSLSGREWVIQRWDDLFFEPLAELIVSAYADHVDGNINDQYASRDGALKFLKNIVVFPGCGVFQPDASFVAPRQDGPGLAGAVLVSQVAPRIAHITQVCVRRELQGLGLGGQLLVRALDTLHRKGFEGVSLSVTADNHGAVRLYYRLGFDVLKGFAAFVWQKP